jgi:hypothetical protein
VGAESLHFMDCGHDLRPLRAEDSAVFGDHEVGCGGRHAVDSGERGLGSAASAYDDGDFAGCGCVWGGSAVSLLNRSEERKTMLSVYAIIAVVVAMDIALGLLAWKCHERGLL